MLLEQQRFTAQEMFKLPDLTNRQWATAGVIAFADFCSAVCVSLQAPFYPAEVSAIDFRNIGSCQLCDSFLNLTRLKEKVQLHHNMA